ncbi:peptidoglycan DD-metalloendopeptidase family protein [Myxococcota bacterium]|nr:peptidoglycan DD-metalloendopeptidase family protein [Myxococcota bacterium]
MQDQRQHPFNSKACALAVAPLLLFLVLPTVSLAEYDGPDLKVPVAGGYQWKVNVMVGDLGGAGDSYHTGDNYYSIDFDNNYWEDGNNSDLDAQDPPIDVYVIAAAAGTVSHATSAGDYCEQWGDDCFVKIDHGGGYVTVYRHMKDDSIVVEEGQWVEQGQPLGVMGTTGESGGIHLHFQIEVKVCEDCADPWTSREDAAEFEGMLLEEGTWESYLGSLYGDDNQSYFHSSSNYYLLDLLDRREQSELVVLNPFSGHAPGLTVLEKLGTQRDGWLHTWSGGQGITSSDYAQDGVPLDAYVQDYVGDDDVGKMIVHPNSNMVVEIDGNVLDVWANADPVLAVSPMCDEATTWYLEPERGPASWLGLPITGVYLGEGDRWRQDFQRGYLDRDADLDLDVMDVNCYESTPPAWYAGRWDKEISPAIATAYERNGAAEVVGAALGSAVSNGRLVIQEFDGGLNEHNAIVMLHPDNWAYVQMNPASIIRSGFWEYYQDEDGVDTLGAPLGDEIGTDVLAGTQRGYDSACDQDSDGWVDGDERPDCILEYCQDDDYSAMQRFECGTLCYEPAWIGGLDRIPVDSCPDELLGGDGEGDGGGGEDPLPEVHDNSDCGLLGVDYDEEQDTDGDGLEDYIEDGIGTSCRYPDSDGDGLTDGQEVAYGYPPLIADGDGDGLLDGEDPDPVRDNDDDDGDGYSEADSDCDDADPTRHPYADEVCDDDVDQDCNNLDLDCDPVDLPDMSVWTFDQSVAGVNREADGDVLFDYHWNIWSIWTNETFTPRIEGEAVMEVDVDTSEGYGYATVIFEQIDDPELDAIDLLQYSVDSYLSMWVYLTFADRFSGVDLLWGSDSANYWHAWTDSTLDGNSFEGGWNQVAFHWHDDPSDPFIRKVGNPNASSINYMAFVVQYYLPYPQDEISTTTFYFDDLRIDDEIHPDLDGDGVEDALDAFPGDPADWADGDGDGVGDNGDAFPSDPDEWADSDLDGTGDNNDAFPADPSESADADGDGLGDVGDYCDETPMGEAVNALGCDESALVILHPADVLNADYWLASQDATGLWIDQVEKVQGDSSIAFSVDTTRVANNYAQVYGYIDPLGRQLDLSSYADASTLLVWVYIPEVTGLSHFELQWGPMLGSDFWVKYADAAAFDVPFETGWNSVAFAWDASATEIGLPDPSAVNSFTLVTVYEEAVFPSYSEFRVDAISITLDVDGDGVVNAVDQCPWSLPVDAVLDDVDEAGCVASERDTDGDGLTDYDEWYLYHTNPAESDTDVDGLVDGDEIALYDTDPAESDTDVDGLSDGEEVTGGTNPLDADTDDDELDDGDEIAAATDPLVPDSDGDDLLDGEEVGTFGTDPLVADTDGDNLSDGWEVRGYDADGDGVVDVDLASLDADPLHADFYVEIDWMSVIGDHNHKPKGQAITRVTNTFAGAHVDNPDGTTGIRLHVDTGAWGGGTSITHDSDLSPVWREFDGIKATSFDSRREAVFHYVVFGHQYSGGCSQGASRGSPATDSLVTLGCQPDQVGSAAVQGNALAKELKKAWPGVW